MLDPKQARPASWWEGAACSDRLDLVDAAYARPGIVHESSRELRRLCRRCPVAWRCLEWAMDNPEWGIWGGTSPKERTGHGGASASALLKRGKSSVPDAPIWEGGTSGAAQGKGCDT